MIWTCSVCGRTERSDNEPPAGWVHGHTMICSAPCMREVYSGLAIAHMFPADATPDEERALIEHEDDLLARALKLWAPKGIGQLAGSIFEARERRAAARAA